MLSSVRAQAQPVDVLDLHVEVELILLGSQRHGGRDELVLGRLSQGDPRPRSIGSKHHPPCLLPPRGPVQLQLEQQDGHPLVRSHPGACERHIHLGGLPRGPGVDDAVAVGHRASEHQGRAPVDNGLGALLQPEQLDGALSQLQPLAEGLLDGVRGDEGELRGG